MTSQDPLPGSTTVKRPPCNQPMVSVIVPVRNGERTIRTVIEDLLDLDYPPERLEILVVDNGSTDRTRILVSTYPVRLLVADSAPNAYTARNAALRVARGDVIAFTDADCRIPKGWLKAGLDALSKGEFQLAAGKVQMCFPDGPTAAGIVDSLLHMDNERWAGRKGAAVTANLIVCAGIVRSVGYFREDLPSGGDFQWCVRARTAGFHMGYVPDAVVFHPARNLRALLRKRAFIGGMHSRWPGVDSRSRRAALLRVLTSLLPPSPRWLRRRVHQRGIATAGMKLLQAWLVLWLANVWWTSAALWSMRRPAGGMKDEPENPPWTSAAGTTDRRSG